MRKNLSGAWMRIVSNGRDETGGWYMSNAIFENKRSNRIPCRIVAKRNHCITLRIKLFID